MTDDTVSKNKKARGQRPQRASKSQSRQAGQPQQRPRKGQPPQQPATENGADVSGLGAIIKRNEYYRDGYRAMQRIALIQGLVIVALILAHFFVINVHQPENRYFATTQDGRLIRMVPLSQPNLSNPALLSWVAQAATEVMTFGFHDYQNRLQESSRYFTQDGWASFSNSLKASRFIERIEQNQQVVTAAPRSAPIVVQESIVNGRYEWTVELPLKLTFEAGSEIDTRNWLVTLRVVRVQQLESPNGLGIEQWFAVSG